MNDEPRATVAVEGSLLDVISTLRYAAELSNRKPRYVVLGKQQQQRLWVELHDHMAIATGVPKLLSTRVHGLDVVRVDEPDCLKLGY